MRSARLELRGRLAQPGQPGRWAALVRRVLPDWLARRDQQDPQELRERQGQRDLPEQGERQDQRGQPEQGDRQVPQALREQPDQLELQEPPGQLELQEQQERLEQPEPLAESPSSVMCITSAHRLFRLRQMCLLIRMDFLRPGLHMLRVQQQFRSPMRVSMRLISRYPV